jgi:hypothetical protein
MAVGDGSQDAVLELLDAPRPGESGTFPRGGVLDGVDRGIGIEDDEIIESAPLESQRGRLPCEKPFDQENETDEQKSNYLH